MDDLERGEVWFSVPEGKTGGIGIYEDGLYNVTRQRERLLMNTIWCVLFRASATTSSN